jgi:hypothetical protein
MIELPDKEIVDQLKTLLSFVPDDMAKAIESRRNNWNKRNEELFKHNNRFGDIKRRMNDGASFSAMDIDQLCSDMAFLASFYDHIIELEGIAVAEEALYSRYYGDNLSIIYYGKIFSGTKTEAESIIRLMIPEMRVVWGIINGAKNDLAFLGIKDQKQTARADSIKMMIEVYKKRHDSRKTAYAGTTTR